MLRESTLLLIWTTKSPGWSTLGKSTLLLRRNPSLRLHGRESLRHGHSLRLECRLRVYEWTIWSRATSRECSLHVLLVL
jgi:hypothetical protein